MMVCGGSWVIVGLKSVMAFRYGLPNNLRGISAGARLVLHMVVNQADLSRFCVAGHMSFRVKSWYY